MNTATISTTTSETSTTNNSSQVTTSVTSVGGSADLTVFKSGPVGPMTAGSIVTYTLTFRNLGTAAAENVVLVDFLPPGVTFVSAGAGSSCDGCQHGGGSDDDGDRSGGDDNHSGGDDDHSGDDDDHSGDDDECGDGSDYSAVFDAATGTVTFHLGTVAADDGGEGGADEGAVTVTVKVVATSGTITNRAVISTTTTESNTANNSSELTHTVVSADVAISKSGPVGMVTTGSTITYTLDFRNLGAAAAEDVVVVDTLPVGVSFVRASGGSSYDAVTRQVKFHIGTLAADDGVAGGADEGTRTVTVKVTATSGSIINRGTISTSTPESDY